MAEEPNHDASFETSAEASTSVVAAPTSPGQILLRIGPGLIIAANIVGSGELIATTKTGAQAGITLLWLIIIGCLIKVFVQVELGRYTISHGQTTLRALDSVPGPRLGANWIVWYWLLMMCASIGQLGGIVGGVGQSMAISFPVTGDYAEAISLPSGKEFERYLGWTALAADQDGAAYTSLSEREQQRLHKRIASFQARVDASGVRGEEALATVSGGGTLTDPYTYDDRIWAGVVAIFTSVLLAYGRYRLIQTVATVLVVTFTFVTLGNVFSLQMTERWHLTLGDFAHGLSFMLPPATDEVNPVRTALFTFGIIGVGASELVAYPYWCLEKGYARFTGPRSDDPAWAERANGWLRVMRYDAFGSMVIYTVGTVAFFLLGATVLYRDGLDPDGMRMVGTLAAAYVPVFGDYAKWLFLLGAIAVLYSTFLVANASHARMLTDVTKVFGWMDPTDERNHRRLLTTLSVVLPGLCYVIYFSGANPVDLIMLSGLMQAMMLPILAGAAVYFRYVRTDTRLRPSRAWDIFLMVSAIGMAIAGFWNAYAALT